MMVVVVMMMSRAMRRSVDPGGDGDGDGDGGGGESGDTRNSKS